MAGAIVPFTRREYKPLALSVCIVAGLARRRAADIERPLLKGSSPMMSAFKKDWGRHETIDATVSTQRAQDIERRLIAGRERNAPWAREHLEEKKS